MWYSFKAIVGMTPSEKSLFILAAVAMLFTACMKENNEQTLADNTIVYDGVTMIHNEGETTDFRITFTVSGNTLTWNFNLREIILHKQ